MAAAQTRPAVPSHGIDLVDEHDAGRILLALFEQVTHPAGTHAHEHFDEVRARNGKERHSGLARDGACEQSLARAGRPHHEHALGNAAAQAGKLLRVFEKSDDLLDLVLGLFDAGHVGEGDLLLVLGQKTRLGLAETHGLAAAHLELAHEEQEDHRDHDDGQPGDQHLLPEPALGLAGDLVGNVGPVELLQCLLANEASGDEGLVTLLQRPAKLRVVAVHPNLQRGGLEVAGRLLDLLDELRERQLLILCPRVDELPHQEKGEEQHGPHQYGLVTITHARPFDADCLI